MGIIVKKKQINIVMTFWSKKQVSRLDAKKCVEKILNEGIQYTQW